MMISTEATDRRLNRSLSAAKRSHYLKTVLKPFSPLHHSIDRKKNHFVAIESDDWGFSGEVRDHESIERLAGKGYEFDQYLDSGALFNTLESKQDLDELFAILSSHKDNLSRYPAFTANYIVTNPDFEQILQSGFSKYYAIPINTGFPDFHKPRGMSQQVWKYGIERKVWMPQFHAYSHFNYVNWIAGLRDGDKRLKDFFEEGMIASSSKYPTISEYVVDPSKDQFADFYEQFSIVARGCKIFKSAFGYAPATTIPPHDLWNTSTERAFLAVDLRFIQSERTRFSTSLGFSRSPRFKPRSILDGLKSAVLLLGPLTKLYRNVRLEQADEDSVATHTSEYLFGLGSPIIVGTHRTNYVSGVDAKIAHEGRKKLDRFLRTITEDKGLVFLTSPELFQIYARGFSSASFGDEILVRNYTSSEVTFLKELHSKYLAFDVTRDHEEELCDSLGENRIRFRVPPSRTVSFRPVDKTSS